MVGPSLFHILGVERSATPDEVRTAWRKIAKEHHPDLAARKGWTPAQTREHERTYREANAAYTVLSDTGRRREYEAELDVIRERFTQGKRAPKPSGARPTAGPPPATKHKYDPPPGTPFRRKFSGFRLEDAALEVQRQAKALRIASDRAEHQARRDHYEDMVRKFTADLLAEVMLAQLQDDLNS